MKLFAICTGIIQAGEDLVPVLLESLKKQGLSLEDNDVLAVASKIVSYSQGRLAKLSDVKPSKEAEELAKKYLLKPEFAELVLREADRIYGGVGKAVLTLKDGVLAPNAGIDSKNAPEGFAVLWPVNLKKWVKDFREKIKNESDKRVGVLVVDSGLVPLRIGTSGLALVAAGFNPIRDLRRGTDLFGKPIMITRHAVADDLASAAHLFMGEATEKTPAVLIRNAPLEFDDSVHAAAEMMMPFDECIFMGTFLAGRCGSGQA